MGARDTGYSVDACCNHGQPFPMLSSKDVGLLGWPLFRLGKTMNLQTHSLI